MVRKFRSRSALAPVLALALLLAGCVSTPAPRVSLAALPASQQAQAARNLRTFQAVWSLVADRHYDPKLQGVDWHAAGEKFGAQAAAAMDETALYATLNAMLGLLKDSHTHALTPAQATERRTHQRARTGFNVMRVEGRWVVADTLPGSPADVAGVRRGWIVTARNGERVGERFDFKPRDGEIAQWEFLDAQDAPVSLALAARPLSTAPRQEMRELTGGFVYLRFDGFDTADRRWLGEQLRAHRDAPGVVIDLRRNPGGETFSLGIAIGEFFRHHVDCGRFISRDGDSSRKNSFQLGSARYGGRVAVLTDAGTGSAAEIFSAVLQDHGRATIIGRKTAGAVLASWFYSLADGGELQLSREDYVTPKGRRLEGDGVEPDLASQLTLADLRAGHDPDLDVALRVLAKPHGVLPP